MMTLSGRTSFGFSACWASVYVCLLAGDAVGRGIRPTAVTVIAAAATAAVMGAAMAGAAVIDTCMHNRWRCTYNASLSRKYAPVVGTSLA